MSQKKQWLYGHHTVRSALENKDRHLFKLFVGSETLQEEFSHKGATLVTKKTFEDLFGPQAVHQGIAAQVSTLQTIKIEDLISEKTEQDLFIVLDQVTDPHNVGAILRSAAAFGAKALITQERNAPSSDSGILAKTASGALEQLPLVSVTNLARSLTTLKKEGYWVAGLDEKGTSLSSSNLPRPLVLVLGAEGKGLRRLVQKECDLLLCLPTSPSYTTLNVSNAAAVALYAVHTSQETKMK